MKFVFFGTDLFAVKVLDTLKDEGLVPALVVTTPDQPVGRKQIITPPPVKVWAGQNNIPVIQPASLKTIPEELKGDFAAFIVASYGKIIPKAILDRPKKGCLNIHPSLLPKYRGPAPLEAAILNGDTETGVTIMQVDEEMDHGPIIAQEKLPLAENTSYRGLRDGSAEAGAKLLAKILPDWLAGKIKPAPQDHSQATHTKKITKADGLIDPDQDPITAWRKYRAFEDWPGVYFFLDKKRILIKKARFENGQFIIERVIPEGKKEVGWAEFENGQQR